MRYPLVRDLADDGFPVSVTCRVLQFSTQGYYRWRKSPCCDRDYEAAYLTNAALDAHRDDPAFGYRFISDELHAVGHEVSERRVWRLCSEQRIWSSFVKKSRSGKKPGVPVHDDLVRRDFSAEVIDELWFTDITEHPTAEGKLYLCSLMDARSMRLVGYSIGPRMTAELAVSALRNAIALRQPAGTIVHSDRGGQGEFNRLSQHPVITEVSDGSSTAGSGSGKATKDEITGNAAASTRSRASVLDRDCQGAHSRRGGDCCRVFPTRRAALVP
jgi:putative transposase